MSKKRQESVRLIWLEAFVALMEQGNISAAGRAIGVDRTVARRYIDKLEKWLKTKLVTRDVRPVLTVFGADFLPNAKRMINFMYGSRFVRPEPGGKESEALEAWRAAQRQLKNK